MVKLRFVEPISRVRFSLATHEKTRASGFLSGWLSEPGAARVRESKTFSHNSEDFHPKNWERCTDSVRIDKRIRDLSSHPKWYEFELMPLLAPNCRVY